MADFPALPIKIVEGAAVSEDASHVLLLMEAEPGPFALAIPVGQMPQLITVLANALEQADAANGLA